MQIVIDSLFLKMCHIQIRFVQSFKLAMIKGLITIHLNHGKLPYLDHTSWEMLKIHAFGCLLTKVDLSNRI